MMLGRFCQLYENDLLNDYGKCSVPEKSGKRISFGKKSSFHGIKSHEKNLEELEGSLSVMICP